MNSTAKNLLSMTESITKIMSIDPGLSTAGWAYSEYANESKILYVKDTGLIEGVRFSSLKAQEELTNLFGRRTITLMEIRNKIVEIYRKYIPDYVESENAFFNRFRPTAFVALNDFICTVRGTLHREFNVPLYVISPKSIKRIACAGDADKNDIKTSVLNNKSIVFDIESSPDSLYEHQYDAIAGAYAFVQLYLEEIKDKVPYDEIILSQKVKPLKKH